jgi:Cu-processing system permease protein
MNQRVHKMLHRILAIAQNTFRESIRSKVLYSVIFFTLLVCIAASAFGRVTIGNQELVVLNFGLFCISLFTILFVTISGSSLVAKELNKRTIFTLLARPIARYEILVGKWLGLFLTATTLIVMMSSALAFYIWLVFASNISIIFSAMLFIIIELMIMCSLILLFSSLVVTPLLIGIFSFALFLAGRSASYVLSLAENSTANSISQWLLRVCYAILPKLETLAISDTIVAGELISAQYYLYSLSYAIGYSVLVLILAALIFKHREFN